MAGGDQKGRNPKPVRELDVGCLVADHHSLIQLQAELGGRAARDEPQAQRCQEAKPIRRSAQQRLGRRVAKMAPVHDYSPVPVK